MTTGDPGNANGREVELLVRWKGAFHLGMFLLGLFGVGENIFGGTLGQVGTGLFNLGCLFWDCFVLMKMLLMEIVVRWERCFSIWDVYVGIVWC